MMNDNRKQILAHVGRTYGTPSYVYFVDDIRQRFDLLHAAFEGRFDVSYAVKCNPNIDLLKIIKDRVTTFDVSSIGEVERVLKAGWPASLMTFSGPGKRLFELERAVEVGIGEMVCESEWELETLNRLAGKVDKKMSIFIRINPQKTSKKMGVNMAGRPSQFGIDEEDLDPVLRNLSIYSHLKLEGFHIYSGTNSVDEEAISENIGNFIDLFTRFSKAHGITPKKLIFGSAFGIPYTTEQNILSLDKLAGLINPQIDQMRKENPQLAEAQCVLEMGRWLVGLEGFMLTSIINEKLSRGTEIRCCDAGFNNHLGACGMMGTIIRRNWPFWKINGTDNEPLENYLLVGPLCTTIDMLAIHIDLPKLRIGDILAVGSSGAYGLTSSPTRFISHPEPREYLVRGSWPDVKINDVTESTANYPVGFTHLPQKPTKHPDI